MVLEEFGVYLDVSDLFELMFFMELVVVGVYGAAKGEWSLVVGVWKSVEVDFERIQYAKELEGVLVRDA